MEIIQKYLNNLQIQLFQNEFPQAKLFKHDDIQMEELLRNFLLGKSQYYCEIIEVLEEFRSKKHQIQTTDIDLISHQVNQDHSLEVREQNFGESIGKEEKDMEIDMSFQNEREIIQIIEFIQCYFKEIKLSESDQKNHFDLVKNILNDLIQNNVTQVYFQTKNYELAQKIEDILKLLDYENKSDQLGDGIGYFELDINKFSKISQIPLCQKLLSVIQNQDKKIKEEEIQQLDSSPNPQIQNNQNTVEQGFVGVNEDESEDEFLTQEQLRIQYQVRTIELKKRRAPFQVEEDQMTFQENLKQYRQNMKEKLIRDGQMVGTGNNPMTIEKLEEKQREIFAFKVQEHKEIGIRKNQNLIDDFIPYLPAQRVLQLTNKFRIDNSLRVVEWNDELAYVGLEHSKNMANHQVPLGHQGLKERNNKVSFGKLSMFENVGYCTSGYTDPAQIMVMGWIKSPGHRQNLLSNSNVMGVSIYRNFDGEWYFTQLFALQN